MATSRPMKHIDREDLYTNLEARVMYLHSFLDFSSRMRPPFLHFPSQCPKSQTIVFFRGPGYPGPSTATMT